MRKRIYTNKKIILIIIILLLLIGYYIYYKNSNIYEEFEKSSNLEELITYEEEIKEEQQKNQSEENKIENEETAEGKEIIIVHITGEIKNWGVIELEEGSRVIDAVNKAGGFTEDADTAKVNLAYELVDGTQVYIPSKNEERENGVTTQKYITTDSGNNVIMEDNNMKKTNKSLVNINEATQTELETLPGIGPSIALKIISYREENGKFSSIEDVKNVSGIGENKFENIKELICV